MHTGELALLRALNERRRGKDRGHVRGGGSLARVRAQGVQLGSEHRVGAGEGLDARSGGEVGGLEERRQVVQCEAQHAEHAVGAVDESEPLLLGEHDRLDARGSQRLSGIDGSGVAILFGST